MTTLIRGDWTYESADPSVGIFGEGWVHCEEDVTDVVVAVVDVVYGETEFTHFLTCECGAQTIVVECAYTGWDLPSDFDPFDHPHDPTGVDCFEAYEGISA